MAAEAIDDLLGAAGKAGLDYMEASLERSKTLIIELNRIGINLETKMSGVKNLKDFVNTAEQMADVNERISQQQKKYAADSERLTKAKERERLEEIKLAQAREKAFDAFEKQETKEREAFLKRIAKQREAETAYAKLKEAYKQASNEAKEYGAQLYNLQKQQDAFNAKAKSTAGALNLSELKRVTPEEIAQLKARLDQSKASATELNKVLLNLETSVGQHQRNVGNYSSSTNGLRMSVQQIARELPSLSNGLAVFFSAIGNNIAPAGDAIRAFREEQKALRDEGKPTTSVFKALAGSVFNWQSLLLVGVTLMTVYGAKLFEVAEDTDKLTEAQKALRKINEEGASSLAKVQTEISALRDRFFAANATLEDQQRVVKELNDKYGDQIGKLKDVSEAEKFFVDRSDAFIQATMLRAKAQAALSAVEEATKENIKNQSKDFTTRAAGIWTYFKNLGDVAGTATDIFRNNEAARRKEIIKNNKVVDDATKQYKDYLKEADDLAKKYKFNFGNADKPDKESADHSKQEYQGAKELNDALGDLRRQRLEQSIATNREIFQNESETLERRILAYKQYQSDRIKEAQSEKDKEIANAAAELTAIEKIQNNGKKKDQEQLNDLVSRHQAALVKQQAAEEKYQAAVANISADGSKEIAQIREQAAKKQAEIRKNASAAELQQVESDTLELLATLSISYDTEQKALAKRYEKNKISRQAYLKAVKQLELENAEAVLRIQINQLEDELIIGNLTREDYDKTKKKVNELRAALNNLAESNAKSSSNIFGIPDEALKKAQSQYSSYAQSAQSVSNLLTAFSQKRVDEINKESQAIDKRLASEISAIEKSTASEEVKQQKIADAQARADAQKQRIEQRVREEQRRDAVRQKALAVALAVVKGVLFVLESTSIPEYIARGVLAAAEVAVAAATPIPSYATGTDDHPGGAARVAEPGSSGKEVVKEPGKAPYVVGKETILDLPRHTQVFPSIDDYVRMTYGMTVNNMAVMPRYKEYDGSNVAQEIDKMRRQLLNEMRQQQPVILQGVNTSFNTYIAKNVR